MMRNQIDLGFINVKQLNRIIEEIDHSYLGVIGIHIVKTKEKMSVVLVFQSEEERKSFDIQSEKLVKDLKSLR